MSLEWDSLFQINKMFLNERENIHLEYLVNPVRELCSLTTIDGGIEPPSIRNDLHLQESVAFSNGVNAKRY